jgi:HAD superfamily hydrolase (TIGR01450 family)
MDPVAPTCVEFLLERYAALLLDASGVLLDAGGPLPGAVSLVRRLNGTGKPYFVLTNDASRLPESAAAYFRGFGLDIEPARIITAGSLLPAWFAARGLQGADCVVLGPPDSERYVERAAGRVVSPDAPFAVLVIGDETGFPFLETVDRVLSGLCLRLDSGADVALVLPNPDLVYPRGGGGFGFASGSLALMFEAALALRYPRRPELRFARLGKPGSGLFREAAHRAGSRDLVMLGDQLATDILGANRFGIDSVLVGGGVTRARPGLEPGGPRPTFYLEGLEQGPRDG